MLRKRRIRVLILTVPFQTFVLSLYPLYLQFQKILVYKSNESYDYSHPRVANSQIIIITATIRTRCKKGFSFVQIMAILTRLRHE